MSSQLNIPIGRIEFLGQVLNIVEHDGRLVAACTDECGMPCEVLSLPGLDAASCRRLMCDSISLLLNTAEISLALTAFSAAGCGRPASAGLPTAACQESTKSKSCRTRRTRLRDEPQMLPLKTKT
jgi:hypothetical protein